MTLKHNDYDYNGNKRSALPHYQCCHFTPRACYTTNNLGPVARSLVSANRWLRGIKMYRFPWYLTLVSTNHASSNPGQTVSSFYRSSQASFSWYSLFYQSNAFLVEVISKTVSY